MGEDRPEKPRIGSAAFYYPESGVHV